MNQQRDRAPQQARRRRLRPLQPRHRQGPPGVQAADRRRRRRTCSATTPRSCSRWPAARRAVQGAAQGRAPQRGPAADRLRRGLPRRLLRVGHPQGVPRLVVDHRHQGGAAVAGVAASCCSTTCWASTTASSGAWSFHKGGNGGFTQVLARAAQAFGAEIRLEAPVASVITRDGRVTGVALEDGAEFDAPIVVSALDPRRTFTGAGRPAGAADATSSTRSAGSGSRAPRRRSTSRSTGCRSSRPSPAATTTSAGSPTSARRWSTSSAPSTRASTAGTARPYLDCAIQSHDRPRHGASRQARDVVLRPVRAVPAARAATGTPSAQNLGDTVQRTLESFFPGFGGPGAPPRGRHADRHRAWPGPVRGQHLRRRVPRPPDVLLPARARAGADYRTPITATTSAARAPTRAVA